MDRLDIAGSWMFLVAGECMLQSRVFWVNERNRFWILFESHSNFCISEKCCLQPCLDSLQTLPGTRRSRPDAPEVQALATKGFRDHELSYMMAILSCLTVTCAVGLLQGGADDFWRGEGNYISSQRDKQWWSDISTSLTCAVPGALLFTPRSLLNSRSAI